MQKRNQQRKAQQRAKQNSIGGMVKSLKGSFVPPITRLRRTSPEGDTILTHPLEIDELLRNSMGQIYAGNVSDQRLPDLAATYLKKLACSSTGLPTFEVPEVHWTDLQQSINDMPDNTPGMDGVKKSDLVILSPSALWLLTRLLQAIEQGKPWPTPTANVRTAYLSTGEDDLDPRGYRGLAILSTL